MYLISVLSILLSSITLASPFEIKLQQLSDMGFGNRSRCIDLLVQFQGDMIETVKQLLEEF